LHFLANANPVHHEIDSVRNNGTFVDQDNLVKLENDQWVTLPAQELLRQHPKRSYDDSSPLAWRKNDAWFVATRPGPQVTNFDLYWLKGPKKEDIVGPMQLPGWKGAIRLAGFSVSAQGEIALLGAEAFANGRDVEKKFVARLFHPVGELQFTYSDLPAPPLKDIKQWEWSPQGKLYATGEKGSYAMEIFSLNGSVWEKEGEARQAQQAGLLFQPRLFFAYDGKPILTWMDFHPCGGCYVGSDFDYDGLAIVIEIVFGALAIGAAVAVARRLKRRGATS